MSNLTSLIDATEQTLTRIAADFSPAVFASSLAAEDMVLTDMILKAKSPTAHREAETAKAHRG